MKNPIFLTLIGFFFNTIIYGQTDSIKGKFTFDVSSGIGAHRIAVQEHESVTHFNSGNLSFPLSINYSLLKEIDIGLEYQPGTYYHTENKLRVKSNSFYLLNCLHLLRRPNFDVSVGTGYGLGNYTSSEKITEKKTRGYGYVFQLFTTYKIKINEPLELFGKLLIDTQTHSTRSSTLNGKTFAITSGSNQYLSLSGFNFLIGLSANLIKQKNDIK